MKFSKIFWFFVILIYPFFHFYVHVTFFFFYFNMLRPIRHLLWLSGAGLKDAKDMIDHSDISMTDRYSHFTSQRHLFNQRSLAEHYINSQNASGVDKTQKRRFQMKISVS